MQLLSTEFNAFREFRAGSQHAALFSHFKDILHDAGFRGVNEWTMLSVVSVSVGAQRAVRCKRWKREILARVSRAHAASEKHASRCYRCPLCDPRFPNASSTIPTINKTHTIQAWPLPCRRVADDSQTVLWQQLAIPRRKLQSTSAL